MKRLLLLLALSGPIHAQELDHPGSLRIATADEAEWRCHLRVQSNYRYDFALDPTGGLAEAWYPEMTLQSAGGVVFAAGDEYEEDGKGISSGGGPMFIFLEEHVHGILIRTASTTWARITVYAVNPDPGGLGSVQEGTTETMMAPGVIALATGRAFFAVSIETIAGQPVLVDSIELAPQLAGYYQHAEGCGPIERLNRLKAHRDGLARPLTLIDRIRRGLPWVW